MQIKIGRFLLSLTLLLFAVAVHAQGPTASISCPATALVGEPVICDGSGSTGVNGQVGWSTTGFADGSAAVDMDYGDNQGAYSHSTLLKGPHVYFTAGTYTVTLKVKNSSGVQSSPATASITISDIPAATAGNFETLTDKGSNSANCTALQNAIDTALGANTVEREIRLPAITYPCALTARAYAGTKYVTIRPADVSWLPGALKRVTPALASNMPKIQAPGVDQTPVTIGGAGRGYIRFLGIEFNRPFSGHLHQFIQIGSGPTTYDDIPTHIIIDRCYFHGNTLDNTVRTVFVNADSFSLINSYTKDIHAEGEEAQGVAGFAGAGIAIARNYIEGYSQQVLFGGADSGIKFSATCASGASSTGCTLSAPPSNLRVGDGISLPVAGGRGPWSASIVRSISGSAITFDQITNQAGTPTAPDTTANGVRYGASPHDILFAQNYTFKSLFYKCIDNPEGGPCIPDPAYNGSYKPVVKNIFELKHAMRVIVVGNVMQNHWGQQGQAGPSILFTPRNQTCYLLTFPHDPVTCPEQVNPWAMVRDVSFEHNKVLNVADFVNITGTDNLNPPGTGDEAGPSAFTQYIRVANNLVTTNASGMNGGGAMAFIFPGARHVRFSHNTEVDPGGGGYIIGSTAAPIGNTATDVVIVNNIAKHLTYGALGDGRFAKDFVAFFFPDGAINYNVFSDDTNNVGPNGELWNTAQTSPTYFPATIGTNTFVSLTNCLAGTSCQLSNTSPYKAGNATPAADGLDMGVNDADVAAVTANAISGDWSGGPGPGSDFVTDTFTEASDTTLASHTGEVGATWTLHPSYSGAALDNGSLKRVYLNTSAAAAYYASGVPPSANYCVQADFNRVTQLSNNISIVIGMDTAADAGLLLRGNDNGTTFQWEVIDRAGGSNTLLTSSSANQPAIGGAAVTMKMCRNGTSVTVFANGVQNTALNATTTTTAVGKAGIRASGQATSTTGIHLDNFSAKVVTASDFVSDTFTEASDTTLASHTGEVGATWTLHPSYSGAALDNGSLKRVYLNTSAAAAYYASGVPPSANYCVQADFNRVTQLSNNISIVIGMDTAADAGLLLRGNDNGTAFQWEVIDRAGGSNTLLTSSSANQPAIGGAAVTMKMCRNGTSVTVFANGTQNTALNATTTTTAVGKAGIRASGQATSTTGIHLDNFHAQ